MPDDLFARAKSAVAKRHVTFRALVIDALEQALQEKPMPFVLKEASAGYRARGSRSVSGGDINRMIDEFREPKR